LVLGSIQKAAKEKLGKIEKSIVIVHIVSRRAIVRKSKAFDDGQLIPLSTPNRHYGHLFINIRAIKQLRRREARWWHLSTQRLLVRIDNFFFAVALSFCNCACLLLPRQFVIARVLRRFRNCGAHKETTIIIDSTNHFVETARQEK